MACSRFYRLWSVAVTSHWGSSLRLRVCLALLTIVVAACGPTGDDLNEHEQSLAALEASQSGSIDQVMLRLEDAAPGFAGLFVRDGVPHVRLTVAADEAAARAVIANFLVQSAAPVSSSKPADIVVLPATRTFRQLSELRDRLTNVLTLPGAVYLDADEAANVVAVGVSLERSIADVEKFAAAVGVPRDALVVRITDEVRPLANLRDQFRPTKGGIQITRSGGAVCTEGFVTTHNNRGGAKGFVTNSHCTSTAGGLESTSFYQAGSAWFGADFVGTEVLDPYWVYGANIHCPSGYRCRTSDSAFVQFDDANKGSVGRIARTDDWCWVPTTYCSLNIDNANPENYITGSRGTPLVGERTDKIGRTTGWTLGSVSATCVTVVQTGTDRAATCQYWVDAPSDSGDSGSPVFQWSEGGVKLVGILWGGGSSAFVFSSINSVWDELGSMNIY